MTSNSCDEISKNDLRDKETSRKRHFEDKNFIEQLNIWKIWIILLLLLQGADEKMNPLFENQGGQNRLNNGNTSNSDMCCIIDKYRISNERP